MPGLLAFDLSEYVVVFQVNPGFKPPLPGSLTLPGYLNPVSDDSSDSYTAPPTANTRSTSVPAITTRGQLSYGAILAANKEGCDQVMPYHSTTLKFPEEHSQKKEVKQNDKQMSPKNLPEPNSDTYRMSALTDMGDDLDEYEQPVSTNSSMRYATLENSEPPKTFAPAVPTTEPKTSLPEGRKKNGVKVLPSNPFAPFQNATTASISQPSSQPVPQPRKKKEQRTDSNNSDNNSPESKSPGGVTKAKRDEFATNRDSHVSTTSTKSSHHYFVLEPEHNQPDSNQLDDYENSVSSPRVV